MHKLCARRNWGIVIALTKHNEFYAKRLPQLCSTAFSTESICCLSYVALFLPQRIPHRLLTYDLLQMRKIWCANTYEHPTNVYAKKRLELNHCLSLCREASTRHDCRVSHGIGWKEKTKIPILLFMNRLWNVRTAIGKLNRAKIDIIHRPWHLKRSLAARNGQMAACVHECSAACSPKWKFWYLLRKRNAKMIGFPIYFRGNLCKVVKICTLMKCQCLMSIAMTVSECFTVIRLSLPIMQMSQSSIICRGATDKRVKTAISIKVYVIMITFAGGVRWSTCQLPFAIHHYLCGALRHARVCTSIRAVWLMDLLRRSIVMHGGAPLIESDLFERHH